MTGGGDDGVVVDGGDGGANEKKDIKSKIDLLYGDQDGITSYKHRSPRIIMDSGREMTVSDLEQCIIKKTNNNDGRQLDFQLDQNVTYNTVHNVDKALLKIPKEEEPSTIKVIKISNVENVKFVHAQLDRDGEKKKFKPACFVIRIPETTPNTVQNCSTGYVIDLCKTVEHCHSGDGVGEPMKKMKQKRLLIIPQIVTKDVHLVPQPHARDFDDTGMYTVTVYNRTGEPGVLNVFLYGYQVVANPLGSIRLEISDTDNRTMKSIHKPLIKNKDRGFGRNVYNLAERLLFDSGTVIKNGKSVEFSCFDKTKSNESVDAGKKLIMDNVCVFMSPRKREWCDPNMFSTPGLFDPAKGFIKPTISVANSYNSNTHCCVFLERRVNLLTMDALFSSMKYTLVNGSMANLQDYKNLRKNRKIMVEKMNTLNTGFIFATTVDNFEPKLQKQLMLIYDYDLWQKKDELLNADEDELIRNVSRGFESTHSASLYRAFKHLAEYFADCCGGGNDGDDGDSRQIKRKIGDAVGGGDDGDSQQIKRIKD